MSRERRKFDAIIKARVAIEALKEQKTASEIASIYKISPMQVSTWKKEFLENSSKVFENKKADRIAKKQEEQLDVLYKKVGILEIERDFLKKKLGEIGQVSEKKAMVEKGHSISVGRLSITSGSAGYCD